jgi:hypothetical protein
MISLAETPETPMSSEDSTVSEPKSPIPQLDLRREEPFTVKYASHVNALASGWDLTLIFGRVDTGANAVFQHTSISLPWPTVKSLIYFLQLQLIAYEKTNGHVPFPIGGISPLPPLPGAPGMSPKERETYKALQKLYQDFAAQNPEAFPEQEQS